MLNFESVNSVSDYDNAAQQYQQQLYQKNQQIMAQQQAQAAQAYPGYTNSIQQMQQPRQQMVYPTNNQMLVMDNNQQIAIAKQQYANEVAARKQTVALESSGIKPSFGMLTGNSSQAMLPVPRVEPEKTAPKKHKVAKKKEQVEVISHTDVVNSTEYNETYSDTNSYLKETMQQIDSVAYDLKDELNSIRKSRTLKGKSMIMANTAKTLVEALSAKTQIIKEMNNTINKVNDLEYRRAKDNRQFESGSGDDKAISDLYSAFISSTDPSKMQMLAPNMEQVMYGNMMANTGQPIYTSQNENYVDQLQYMVPANNDISSYEVTPEMKAMLLEGNKDVKTVVRYNPSTGAKSFDVVDIRTGQSIPGVEPPDETFIPNLKIDQTSGIAFDRKLNLQYDLLVENGDGIQEY